MKRTCQSIIEMHETSSSPRPVAFWSTGRCGVTLNPVQSDTFERHFEKKIVHVLPLAGVYGWVIRFSVSLMLLCRGCPQFNNPVRSIRMLLERAYGNYHSSL